MSAQATPGIQAVIDHLTDHRIAVPLLTHAAHPRSRCCGEELAEGAAALWCPGCGRQVPAADIDQDVLPAARPSGRGREKR